MSVNPAGEPLASPPGGPLASAPGEPSAGVAPPVTPPVTDNAAMPSPQPESMVPPGSLPPGTPDFFAEYKNVSGNNPAFMYAREDEVEGKIESVKVGGEIAEKHEPIPEDRQCQDCIMAVVFIIFAVSMIGWATYGSIELGKENTQTSFDIAYLWAWSATGAAAGAIMALTAYFLIQIAPACMIWTALLVSPCLLIAYGVVLLTLDDGDTAQKTIGGVIAGFGALLLCCFLGRWRESVPFTCEVLDICVDVMRRHPAMLIMSLFTTLWGMLWPLCCILAYFAAAQITDNDPDDGLSPPGVFTCVVGLVWGGMTMYYVTHVAICGVYARWYYEKEQVGSVCRSIKVAMFNSLGSSATAGLVTAIVRGIQAMINYVRESDAVDDNACLRCCLCCLECCVKCIGDMLDYFNQWGLTQAAIRGTSFCESARITYAMMTYSNMSFIFNGLLIDFVGDLIIMLCALAGAGVAFSTATMYKDENGENLSTGDAIIGGFLGLNAGACVGSSVATVITSGSKTVLISWVERPMILFEKRPELTIKFIEAITGQTAKAFDTRDTNRAAKADRKQAKAAKKEIELQNQKK